MPVVKDGFKYDFNFIVICGLLLQKINHLIEVHACYPIDTWRDTCL